MASKGISERAEIIKSVSTPLKFFALGLLIVEFFIGLVISLSNLTEEHKFDMALIGTGIFVLVVIIVSYIVWGKPGNLINDKEAYLPKLMKDFDEEKIAELNEKVNKIMEKVVPKSESGKAEFDRTFKLIKNQFVDAYSVISSSEKERQSYLNNGRAFEELVRRCLIELKIPLKVLPLQQIIRPDFVAIKKDEKIIPIEVKYYMKRVVGNELPSKLVNQMKKYMDNMNIDESILIISSEVTPEALKLFKELSGKNKIHIIVGHTKEELKSQLVNVLT